MSRRRLDALVALAGPGAAGRRGRRRVGSQLNPVRQLEFGEALVSVAIVVALYVFVGNSGVLSFGHISFVAVGAYLSGILTLDAEQKNLILPTMFGVLRHTHTVDRAVAAARRRRRRRCSRSSPGSR